MKLQPTTPFNSVSREILNEGRYKALVSRKLTPKLTVKLGVKFQDC